MRLQPYRHKGRTSRTRVRTLNLHKPIVMLYNIMYVIQLRTNSKIKFIKKTVKVKTRARTNTTYQVWCSNICQ